MTLVIYKKGTIKGEVTIIEEENKRSLD
jgi:hypothetical protein